MKTNKNGVKLLAALMVLVMAFAGTAVFLSEESSAETRNVKDFGELNTALSSGNADIKITDDITVTSTLNVTGNVTLNLNGHTITGEGYRVFLVSGNLNLTGEGVITSENIDIDDSVIRVGTKTGTTGTPTLTVGKDVTVYGPDSYAITIFGSETKMVATINGTVISNATAAISGNGTNTLGKTEITVNDGAIIKSTATGDDGDAAGIYHPQSGVININGGYIEGTGSGIAIKSGTLNIMGGTIKSTGKDSTPTEGYSNGVNASGAAIQIEANKSYKGNPDNNSYDQKGIQITISGGIIESENGVAIYEYLASGTTKTSLTKLDITGGKIVSVKDGANYLFSDKVILSIFKITGGSFSKAISDADATISVAAGSVLEADVTLSCENNKLSIANGGSYDGTITYDGSSASVKLKAGAGGVELKAGSIIIGGKIDESTPGTITVTSGTAKLKSDVPEGTKIVINEGTTLEVPESTGAIKVSGEIVVNGTFENKSNNGVTIDSTGKMSVSGEVKATQAITNNGSISITSSKAVVPTTISGTGTIDASAGSTEGTISGQYSTNSTFTNTQVITVTADTRLVDNAVFTIQGTLIIPEGVTLYIQDNARLVISGQAANLKVDGNIVIESAVNAIAEVPGAGALLIANNAKVENNGTIELSYSSVDGDVSEHPGMNISSTFVNNGQIIVGSESFLYIWGSNLTNSKDASIFVDGQIELDNNSNKISNAGEIVINGFVKEYNLTIELTDADAVVDIISVTVKNDVSAYYAAKNIVIENNLAPAGFIKEGAESSITFTIGAYNTVTGVEITPTSVLNNTTKKYSEYLIINGAIGYTKANGMEKNVSATFNNVKIEEALDVAAGFGITASGIVNIDGNLTLNEITDNGSPISATLSISGTVNVNGTVIAVKGSQITSSSGTVNVNGTVEAGSAFNTLSKVNGTYYVNKVGTKITHILTTFENAVEGMKDPTNTYTTKNVTVYGKETVSDAVVVDNGVKVAFNTGATLTINKKSVVTITDGSSINGTNGAITVNGALVIENKKTGDKASAAIVSDVTTQTTDNNGYRIYSGLAYALGNVDDGSVVKLNKDVTIEDSISIPKEITVDAIGKTITIAKEKVLTIDGTLSINDSTTITCKGEKDSQAKVILNGTVQSSYNSIYEKYPFAAAYYSVKGVYYAEPVASAISKIGDADDGTVTLKGEVSAGDLAIIGSADKVVTLVVTEKLTAGTITLDEAQVTIKDDASFNGTIADANGSVKLDRTAAKDTTVISVTVKDSKVLTIAGGFEVADKKTITLSGEVVLNGFTGNDVTILGDVTVSAASSADKLAVEGNINIAKNTILTTKDATVLGTIVVETSGTLKVDGKMIVGEPITSLGADGTVTGKIELTSGSFVKVYAGSEVTKTESVATVTLNGVDYATVYFKGDVLYKDVISKAELEKIPGYNVTYPFTDTSKIGAGEYDFVLVAKDVIVNISVDVGTKLQIGAYFYNQTTKNIEFKAGELTVIASVLPGFTGTAVAELWIDGKKVQDIDGSIVLTPEMVDKEVVIVSTYGAAPVDPETPAEPSTGFDVYAKAVDGKVQVRAISDDGYFENGVLTITLSYTYYDDFAGDYMTDYVDVPYEYISDEETVDFTYELEIPTDFAYYAASAVFVSGDLKDETGAIFI